MEKLVVILTWTCAAIVCTIFVAVYVVFGAVYLSLTWPWYAYRFARRVAFPR